MARPADRYQLSLKRRGSRPCGSGVAGVADHDHVEVGRVGHPRIWTNFSSASITFRAGGHLVAAEREQQVRLPADGPRLLVIREQIGVLVDEFP